MILRWPLLSACLMAATWRPIVGFFDTVPWGEDKPGFGGSWSNYPFFESGVIVATSGEEGVFFLKRSEVAP